MTKRDWELLDKQFSYLRPAPRYGSAKLAAVMALLLVGLGIGSAAALRDPNAVVAAAPKGHLPIVLASYDQGRRTR